MSVVSVTESAAQPDQAPPRPGGQGARRHALRMKVVGGGCSGLQYQLAFDDQVREIDAEIEVNGVRVRRRREERALPGRAPRSTSSTR